MAKNSRKLFNIIMAVIVSVGAWMFVVYNYYPMTDVKYSGVPVSYEGHRELAERGLAVSEASTGGISVKLNQKRINYNNYSAKDIKVVANVSQCVAGENSVTLSVTGPKDTSVISHDTDAIKVMVERIDSAYLDIDVIYDENTSEDEEPLVIDMSESRAEVVCASSKTGSIKSVAAVLSHSEVDDTVKSYTVNLVALGADGNIIPYAVIYPGEVSLDACAGAVKNVALTAPIVGDKDEDYERKCTLPETVTLIGPVETMANLESVTAEETDIGLYYQDSEIELTLNLPEGVRLKNPEAAPMMKLEVDRIEKPQQTEEDTAP